MKRDVDLKLIYIILILILALGVTVIFYQVRYENLKKEYETSLAMYNQTIQNLSIKQKYLYENLSEINVSINRELALASKLETRTQQLENLSRELAFLQQQLFEYQRNYDSLSINYTNAVEILNKHTASIGRMQEKIDRLRTDVENSASKEVILQDIQQLQSELNKLNSY